MKAKLRIAALLSGLAAISVLVEADAERDSQAQDFPGGDLARVWQGYAIAPVPLNLNEKNPLLEGIGSYIVNAQGACSDCHTSLPFQKGSDPFKGEPEKIDVGRYLAGGRPFGPGIVSPNITPDVDGRPAGLTREEFINLLRTGRDPNESNKILQVMPWPVYGKMAERDLSAIYEYLSAIPSAQPPAPGT